MDYRDPSTENAAAIGDLIAAAAQDVAHCRGLQVEPLIPAAPLHETVREAIQASAQEHGYSSRDLPSGAGHDSQNLATLAPTGMIFVPSGDGRSHSPAELTHDADIVRGANVFLGTLMRLASASTA